MGDREDLEGRFERRAYSELDRFERRPRGTLLRWFMWLLGLSLAVWMISGVVGMFTGAADNAGKVVQKEFYPDVLLRKYEWFKDTSAMLDKKLADLKVYEARDSTMMREYRGVPRRDWPPRRPRAALDLEERTVRDRG